MPLAGNIETLKLVFAEPRYLKSLAVMQEMLATLCVAAFRAPAGD